MEAGGRILHIPPPIIATPLVMICDLSPGLLVTVQGRHFGLGFGFDLCSGSAGDDVDFLLIKVQTDGHHQSFCFRIQSHWPRISIFKRYIHGMTSIVRNILRFELESQLDRCGLDLHGRIL